MANKRKFLPSSIGLVVGRLRRDGKPLKDVHNNMEALVIQSGILEHAPFKWIGLMYRYGERNMLKPEYDRINKKYGDQTVAIEIKMALMKWCDKHDTALMYELLMIGALEAVLDICRKYKLDTSLFEAERAKYRHIPETVDELAAMSATTQKTD